MQRCSAQGEIAITPEPALGETGAGGGILLGIPMQEVPDGWGPPEMVGRRRSEGLDGSG